ncbi:MAG: HAD family hydrolase [Bacteroidales bacterium]
MQDTEKQVDLLKSSFPKYETLKQARKDCSIIAKQVSKETGLPKADISKLKNFQYTRGKGCLKDSLDIDPNAKEVDRVSKVFKSFLDVLEIYDRAKLFDDLEPYLEALKSRGVEITMKNSGSEYSNSLHNDVINMASYYGVQKECDDDLKEMSEVAPEILLSPKNKFKAISSLAFSKHKGSDIDDKCQQSAEEILLYSNAIELLQNSSF